MKDTLKKALILVDWQQQWLDKSSNYYVGEIAEIINRTNQLIEYCRARDYKIIFIQHIEADSTEEFAPDSKNIELIPSLARQAGDIIVTKNKISPFYKTSLEKELKNVSEIVTTGILTNLCVRSLVQDVYDRDFEVQVIKDCCVAFDKKTQEFTFADLKATRPEIEFLDFKEFIIK